MSSNRNRRLGTAQVVWVPPRQYCDNQPSMIPIFRDKLSALAVTQVSHEVPFFFLNSAGNREPLEKLFGVDIGGHTSMSALVQDIIVLHKLDGFQLRIDSGGLSPDSTRCRLVCSAHVKQRRPVPEHSERPRQTSSKRIRHCPVAINFLKKDNR